MISAQRSEMNPVPCSRSNSQVPTPVVSTARFIHSALESPPHCDSVSERLSIVTSIRPPAGYSIRIRSARKIFRLPKAIFDSSRRCLRERASRSSRRRNIPPERPAPELSPSSTEIATGNERLMESTTGNLIHVKYGCDALFALRELPERAPQGIHQRKRWRIPTSLVQMAVLDPIFAISRFRFFLRTHQFL